MMHSVYLVEQLIVTPWIICIEVEKIKIVNLLISQCNVRFFESRAQCPASKLPKKKKEKQCDNVIFISNRTKLKGSSERMRS